MSFLEDLHAEVQHRGAEVVARDGDLSVKLVKRFLADPMDIRISTFSHLCRAVNMPHGEFHLVDMKTRQCVTCDGTDEQHYPLFPKAAGS